MPSALDKLQFGGQAEFYISFIKFFDEFAVSAHSVGIAGYYEKRQVLAYLFSLVPRYSLKSAEKVIVKTITRGEDFLAVNPELFLMGA